MDRQSLLVYSGLLLTYSRSESLLYLLSVAVIVLAVWIREREVRISWPVACSPVFLTIPVLLNLNFTTRPGQRPMFAAEDGEPFFAFTYLWENLELAVFYFFNPTFALTSAVFISVIGILGTLFFGVRVLTRLREVSATPEAVAYTCVFPVTVACFLFIESHFWGQLLDFQAVRFALPLYVMLIPGAVYLLHNLLQNQPAWSWPAFSGLCIYAMVASIPTQAQHQTTASKFTANHYAACLEFANSIPYPDVLFIGRHSLGLIANGKASMSIRLANMQPDVLANLVNYGLYRALYTEQLLVIDNQTGDWIHGDDITTYNLDEESFRVTPVHEVRVAAAVLLRINRIDAVRNQKGEWISLEYGSATIPPQRSYPDIVQYLFSQLPFRSHLNWLDADDLEAIRRIMHEEQFSPDPSP